MTRTSSTIYGVRIITGAMTIGGLIAVAGTAAAATSASPPRPLAEHVPTAIQNARLAYDASSIRPSNGDKTVALHGPKAQLLIKLFDALKAEPPDTVHCDIAGGPQTTVTFHGAQHTWVVTQAACTNIEVTRDGKGLPTLLPSQQWENAVNHDLGR